MSRLQPLPLCLILWTYAVGTASAQSFFPPPPEHVTTVQSKLEPGITISYKEPGICETTPGVRSFAGYVHMPGSVLADTSIDANYTLNTFFWFFESRKDPQNAPLSIWMNGGPGSSSMLGALQENGPCKVRADSNSTVLNEWSFNNAVNMIYIDQPLQTGFSYDILMNGTIDPNGGVSTFDSSNKPSSSIDWLNREGTFSSQSASNTANNTENAARTLWHFAQVWFQEFPDYKPNDNRVSIWTESYGGKYGPAFSSFFEEQNERIANGTFKVKGELYQIHLDTLGIINGCIDSLTSETGYPIMAFNNTYGIQAINQSTSEAAISAFNKVGGCKDQINNCRQKAAQLDPNFTGANNQVNSACLDAYTTCQEDIENPYLDLSDRSFYDITAPSADPFPPEYYNGFLNQAWVQKALGVPLNYTESVGSVNEAFFNSGDYPRGEFLQDLGFVLDSGIKVAMVYGDRDYACNWIGGEASSFAVQYSNAKQFASAGYTEVKVNSSYVGGMTRQYGNFSFTRVFESGHEVPAYQPETAWNIFNRAMTNVDIATGTVSTVGKSPIYSTKGNSSAFNIKNDVPPMPKPTCYVLAIASTCTEDQQSAVMNGALVQNFILMEDDTKAATTTSSGSTSSGSSAPKKGDGGKLEVAGAWAVTLSLLAGIVLLLE
ncbi:alpha/beta-hydrolase [Rhizodiscina lignyota]|uniref:Carboxypeptidase n=1 Tax=Rhizodiscina lignyota TaxID=1504668 RepID=A0A9P4M737_9PEZI|nr:alpha/beta-hydrolase [Rhizodiscina lignyota]